MVGNAPRIKGKQVRNFGNSELYFKRKGFSVTMRITPITRGRRKSELEGALAERIIGQDAAMQGVVPYIRMYRPVPDTFSACTPPVPVVVE